LSGRVTSGRRRASRELLGWAGQLEGFAGEKLQPGSLNVYLDRPLRLCKAGALRFDGGGRMLWRASLNGLPVLLYRWRECPFHIIEILSAVDLRTQFGLRDGDAVTLTIEQTQVDVITPMERAMWRALWAGRERWHYSKHNYYAFCFYLGVAQQEPLAKGVLSSMGTLMRRAIKRMPLLGPLAKTAFHTLFPRKYTFSRLETNASGGDELLKLQLRNVLDFTKTSNSLYSAKQFPAGYHTLTINGHRIQGQRDPVRRLASVPFDFQGKSILDIGCNAGGMIHPLAHLVKWAVGIDYDPRMINAANRIKQALMTSNTSFYVLDLQKDPLALISDFIPEQRADICFLLAVCMWLKNWKQVIDFAQEHSRSMLFETNGTPAQQREQIRYLRKKYRNFRLLTSSSEDDAEQKNRQLLYLTDPLFTANANWPLDRPRELPELTPAVTHLQRGQSEEPSRTSQTHARTS